MEFLRFYIEVKIDFSGDIHYTNIVQLQPIFFGRSPTL